MAQIRDLLGGSPTLSFEFFPPKTDAAARGLEKTVYELRRANPTFVSVTYGAGGTDAHRTRDLVVELTLNHPFPTMAHLTCMNHRRQDLVTLLEDYRDHGVRNILALGGDPPADGSAPSGELTYASELVDLVRTVDDFTVGVAAFPELHPRSENTGQDRRFLAHKLERADFAVTQFFFDAAPYFRMVEELASLGCHTPILPGLMPVTNPASIARFAAMNGTRVPPGLWARISEAGDDDRLEIALEAASQLGHELLDGGAPGVHLYTLNRSDVAMRVAENLGFVSAAS